MDRQIRIWLRAGFRTYALGSLGRYLCDEHGHLILITNTGALEALI